MTNVELERLKLENKTLKLLQRLSDVIADLSDDEDVFEVCLKEIASEYNWPVGHVYFLSPKDSKLLVPGKIWFLSDKSKFKHFKEVTEKTNFRFGSGLPGRVLESRNPAWIVDVMQDKNFPRNKILKEASVHGALGIPVISNGEVIAVLEFFSEEKRSEDVLLLSVLSTVGHQLGSIFEKRQLVWRTQDLAVRLELALEGASLGTWDWDLRDNGVKFDRRWCSMLGLKLEETPMELKTWEDRVHPNDLDKCYEDIKAYMDGKTDCYENFHRMKHEDGHWVYILDRGRFSGWESGKPIRFTGTHFDITELKRNEEKLQEFADELHMKKIEAEQALKVKTTFLANMSHEIRTPLNGILSSANLLLDSVKKAEDAKLLEIIHSCGDSLLATINDVLDFSKMEAGKMQLEEHPFNLRSNVQEVLDLLEAKAQDVGASIMCDIESDVPSWVRGDVTRFRQILLNLVSNAIKFTKNKVCVKVIKKGEKNGKHELLISVEDNGIGISEAAQLKLFRSFSQMDGSTTRKYGGTGLGLAICKGLTEAMGGEIGVKSQLNAGSTFFFSLTVAEADEGNCQRKPRLSEINPKMGDEHPLRILMAEDNSVNQMVARKLLAKLGYRIDIVGNGIEAIEAVEKQSYDLVLMDQQMPEMDGLEATRKICERYKKEERPRIVALTANVFKEDRDRCIEAGMDGFLSKPMQIEEVVQELLKCEKNLVERRAVVKVS